jgi:hypothetical protein
MVGPAGTCRMISSQDTTMTLEQAAGTCTPPEGRELKCPRSINEPNSLGTWGSVIGPRLPGVAAHSSACLVRAGQPFGQPRGPRLVRRATKKPSGHLPSLALAPSNPQRFGCGRRRSSSSARQRCQWLDLPIQLPWQGRRAWVAAAAVDAGTKYSGGRKTSVWGEVSTSFQARGRDGRLT